MARVGEAEPEGEGEALLAEKWRAAERSAATKRGEVREVDEFSGSEALLSRMCNGEMTSDGAVGRMEKGGTSNIESRDGQETVVGRRGTARTREVTTSGQGVPRGVVILVVVFLDLFAVGMAMPLVTPLIKELGASPLQVGFLSSTYGIVQLVTGPFFGLLSDRMGRRFVILVAYAGAGASYLLLGQSTTVTMVVVSRVLLGLTKHSMNAVKAYVADHTTASNRAVELGRSHQCKEPSSGPWQDGDCISVGHYGRARCGRDAI
ncbi:hypothetical protein CLOM_g15977 [Closterium sp. NIES-68]|nr:hypothetical protein CLOM_g15977 [Closterium sp. NIES-68]GJP85688.1 hypothetical protein CLOP_g15802 [Closterium sp. NIES-67]